MEGPCFLSLSVASRNRSFLWVRISEVSPMKWGKCRFGRLKVDGEKYSKDVVLDRGVLRTRKKKPSREFREQFGHTPVSLKEEIPWECKRLVIGTGQQGRLPVMDEVAAEARQR